MRSDSEYAAQAMRFLGFTMDSKLTLAQHQDFLATVMHLKRHDEQDEKAKRKEAKPMSMRAVLASIGEHAESPLEELLIYAINCRSLLIGEFKTQYPIGPYSLDVAFPAVKLCVEADGKQHRLDPAQIAHDQRRTIYLANLGWTVIRFNWNEIRHDPYGCGDRISETYSKLLALNGMEEPWNR